MSEIRNLTRNGETFYPLTCSDAVLNRDGEPLGPVNDIFDVSEYNASGTPSVLAKYDSLSLALAAIPTSKQKGGMTIRYVQTSDNKYVQFRLSTQVFSLMTSEWEQCGVVNISSRPNFDFSISDEKGNVLAVLKDGGIKTKYFDSDKIENIKKFKNKSIGIIGDSISTYSGWLPSDIQGYDGASYAKYYPKGNVNNVELTWWYQLAQMLGIESNRISNCAWSGSKVTGNSLATDTAFAGCSDRRVEDLEARGFVPDIIICFISCNDWAHDISIGTWQAEDGIPTEGTISTMREAYAVLLNKLHVNYPLSRIFVCTNLDDYKRDGDSNWPSNNGNGVSTYEWNKNIVELADIFGCDIIDMHKCGINYQNIATYFSVDTGLHPNKEGMELMAKKAFCEIISKY